MGEGGQLHAAAALLLGRGPVTHYTGGLLGPRAGLDGWAENLVHIRIRTPDGPARTESLYRLRCPDPFWYTVCIKL